MGDLQERWRENSEYFEDYEDPSELELVELFGEDYEEAMMELHALTLHNIDAVPSKTLFEQWKTLNSLRKSDPQRMVLIRSWAKQWPRELRESDLFNFPKGLETEWEDISTKVKIGKKRKKRQEDISIDFKQMKF